MEREFKKNKLAKCDSNHEECRVSKSSHQFKSIHHRIFKIIFDGNHLILSNIRSLLIQSKQLGIKFVDVGTQQSMPVWLRDIELGTIIKVLIPWFREPLRLSLLPFLLFAIRVHTTRAEYFNWLPLTAAEIYDTASEQTDRRTDRHTDGIGFRWHTLGTAP